MDPRASTNTRHQNHYVGGVAASAALLRRDQTVETETVDLSEIEAFAGPPSPAAPAPASEAVPRPTLASADVTGDAE